MRFRFLSRILVILLLLFSISACNSELSGAGDSGALSILSDALPQAFIGESYNATIRAVRGLTPYTFELTNGELPPGLELSGGSILGTPTEEGSFAFTITVTDGKLSKSFAEYSLSVGQAPPAELTLNVPTTEVQRTITLRADVRNVRDLQAFRTLVSWDASRFEFVDDSVRRSRENLALFFEASEGRLHVDLAILGGSLSEDRRMFEFDLRPIEPSFLELTTEVEFTSSSNIHGYASIREGTPVIEENDPNLDPVDPDAATDIPEESEPQTPTEDTNEAGDSQP